MMKWLLVVTCALAFLAAVSAETFTEEEEEGEEEEKNEEEGERG